MKKLNLTIIISIILANFGMSQEMRKKIEYVYNIQKINDAKSVTWFGWDYSHLVINDPEHLNVDIVKSVVIPYWYIELDNRGLGTSVVKKKFKKKTLIVDAVSIQSLVLKVDNEEFQNISKAGLTINSVKSIVSNYDVSGSGIGVVAIANQMKKSNISVTGFVVVFDIETKELLYVMNGMGKAGDKGSFARFYSKGIAEVMGLFYDAKLK